MKQNVSFSYCNIQHDRRSLLKHSHTLKEYGIVLSQIHVIQYSREMKGIGMGSDRNSYHLQKHITNTHASVTKIYTMFIGVQKYLSR